MEPGEHTELSVVDQFHETVTKMRADREAFYRYREQQRRLFLGVDFGFHDALPVAIDPGVRSTERARLLYEAENKANEFVMAGDALVEAVLYKLLYARGLRIASIDTEIKKALDQRLGIR